MNDAASIGIIGGADGPTAIFITGPVWTSYAVPVLLMAACLAGWLLWRRYRKNHD